LKVQQWVALGESDVIEALISAPGGIIKQWLSVDEDGKTGGVTDKFSAVPSGVMPGTQQFNGKELMHVAFNGTIAEMQAELIGSMTLLAAQDYLLTWDYDADGNITGGPHGVHIPVPDEVADFLLPIETYDDQGNVTGTTPQAPGAPLHTFVGQSPWVWATAPQGG
jgi:hypothetical protein